MNKQEMIKELLTRSVAEVVKKSELEALLNSDKKLRVKLGIDPTSPSLHIGRAVALWKLRAFQDLGHQVIFLVGDFTGTIGDTSDKDAERPMLTREKVKQNMKTYFEQAFKILDKSKTETVYNSKWLSKLSLSELIELADIFGVSEFMSRELIKKRYNAGKRISVREFLYPILQGYDSVALKADVEIGGTDQRFNLLAGRTMQPIYGQKPQQIMMLELIPGTDGRKMSSSWGNVINLTDDPYEMFGKVMSIPDSLIKKYFEATTKLPLADVNAFLKEVKHPRDQKLRLAYEIVNLYHGDKEARAAGDRFVAQFTHKEVPDDIPSKTVKPGTYPLSKLLVLVKLASSNSEARRLIAQGGVKLDGQTVKDDGEVVIAKQNDLLIQVGKRRYIRIK